MLGNHGSFPAELNIRFAVALRNLSRNVKKYDFSIVRDVTPSNMSHAMIIV
jgi:hypothetical protein